MKATSFLTTVLVLTLLKAGQSIASAASPITLVVCGDSTVADYDTNKTTMRGWGQLIGEGFSGDVTVLNHARNGRSTKTFISEGLLAKAVATKANYALIQFGHNDSHAKDRPESTDPATNFKDYLRRFVNDFRAAGTKPILVTPMHRRNFDPSGKPTAELQPYAQAMKEVAEEMKVPLVDLHASSGELLAKLGEAESAELYFPGDRTHFDIKGARTMAGLVLARLGNAVPVLKMYIPANNSPDAAGTGPVAPKPLYRDPVYDGAADPVVIWNPHVKRWWMFYTNRRANAPGLSGVAWVHGTRLGIAESADEGAIWKYVGTADIELPKEIGGDEPTHWAPEVYTAPDGTHHMFLTVVPGVFENWNHPRTMVRLTSNDLKKWVNPQPLKLASDRVIDACILRLTDGTWRLWYNNERDRKSIYFADSKDLVNFEDKGKAVGDQGGEGPKVFRWKAAYWMITDVWQGLAVYRSDDALNWKRQQGNLVEQPGKGTDDEVKGGHPDVVVSRDRAFLFYFTHPGRRGAEERKDGAEQRRSSIQVVELHESDGKLTCDRDQPTRIQLASPAN